MRYHTHHAIKPVLGRREGVLSHAKKEHNYECEKEAKQRQTRSVKDKAQQENLKSAITDHCKRQNHIMDWVNAKVIKQEKKNNIFPYTVIKENTIKLSLSLTPLTKIHQCFC